MIDLSDLLDMTETARLKQAGMQKLQARLKKKQEEIERYQTLLRSLYESLTDGIIDRQEYEDLKKTYARRRAEAEEQAETVQRKMEQDWEDNLLGRSWMEQFKKHANITELDRRIVVSLIERILVYHDRRVEIVYRFQDEFQRQMELLLQARAALPEKEAM